MNGTSFGFNNPLDAVLHVTDEVLQDLWIKFSPSFLDSPLELVHGGDWFSVDDFRNDCP